MDNLINQFKDKLSSVIDSRKINSEIIAQQQYLNDSLQPSLVQLQDVVNLLPMQSAYAKTFLQELNKYHIRQPTWVGQLAYLVNIVNMELLVLEKETSRSFASMTGTDTINYLQVNILNHLSQTYSFLDNVATVIGAILSFENAKKGGAPYTPCVS